MAIYALANGSEHSSVYYLITRSGKSPAYSYTYQKLRDPVEPFGDEKPPHHSLLRLRDFDPNLQDLLIVASTASADIGLLSRSKKSLDSGKPEDKTVGVFTTTELLDDTNRPTLPMTESMTDSVPIGVSLDLSAKDKVYKPIPTEDEIEESAGPLPGLLVLTHEGVLCAWWVVYTESIMQKTTYSGLAAIQDNSAAPAQPQPQSQQPTPSAFGKASPNATPSPFGAAQPASSPTSAFGGSSFSKPSSGFGAPATLGQNSSPWGSSSNGANPTTGGATFGSSGFSQAVSAAAPAFGKPAALGAFGQASSLGSQTSPWGSSGGATSSFGTKGFASFAKGNDDKSSPFGSAGSNNTSMPGSTGGFAGFASKGGFESVGGNNSGSSIFGSGNKTGSPFGGGGSTDSVFLPKSQDNTSGSTPFGSQPFQLKSTFKPDTSAQQEKPDDKSLFGSGFTSALDEKPSHSFATPEIESAAKDEEMDTGEPEATTPQPKQPSSLFTPNKKEESTTPTTTPGPVAFGISGLNSTPSSSLFPQTPKPGGLFGAKSDEHKSTEKTGIFGLKPAGSQPTASAGLFGSASKSSGFGAFSKPDTTLSSGNGGLFGQKLDTNKSNIFGSANKDANAGTTKSLFEQSEMDAPLPPDSTSKTAYPLGESSSSSATSTAPSQSFDTTSTPSKSDSAPLPPDFTASVTPKTPKTFDSVASPVTRTPAEEAPLPPDFTAVKSEPVEDTPRPAEAAPLPPDFTKETSKPSSKSAEVPLPPDPVSGSKPAAKDESSKKTPQRFVPKHSPSIFDSPAPTEPVQSNPFAKFSAPGGFKFPNALPGDSDSDSDEEDEEEDEVEEEEDDDEGEEDEDEDAEREDDESEGSGTDVAKDLSPTISGFTTTTPSFTPQHSFGGPLGAPSPTATKQQPIPSKPLFGELNRNTPLFAKPTETNLRSPSPVRSAIPNRVLRGDATRSVSAPGMASNLLGPKGPQFGQPQNNVERPYYGGDSFMMQQRQQREKQEAAQTRPLVDEEDDELQKTLTSQVEGALELDEFIAHSNSAAPAKDSIPAQVEAVYRDINSMIDTLGLNARAVKAFTKGHMEQARRHGRTQEELENPDNWILGEIDVLGELLDNELASDLAEGRVNDLDGKMRLLQDLAKDMYRLRAKQDDLRRLISARMDPEQTNKTRNLPLSAEQSAQQNELRREFARFTKLLSETEEALTLLKTKIATLSGPAGRTSGNTPTVDAVLRTITKMTSMAEKRSGDIDVLENQLRKVRLNSASREGSPLMTPQGRRSIMFSPDNTPSRSFRHSLSGSVSFGIGAKNSPQRKKTSGFSKEEKSTLMEKKARKKAVLDKLKSSVIKRGVSVWAIQDDMNE